MSACGFMCTVCTMCLCAPCVRVVVSERYRLAPLPQEDPTDDGRFSWGGMDPLGRRRASAARPLDDDSSSDEDTYEVRHVMGSRSNKAPHSP